MQGRLSSVQVLRFVAAFAVTLMHALHVFGDDNRVGAIGVDVFFVISGYIMAGAKKEHFLRNRAIRVLPLYYAVLIVFLVGSLGDGTADARRWFAAITLWPALDSYVTPQMGLAWTLCFEALFYVAVWLVMRGVRPVWLAAAWIVSVGLGLLTHAPLFCYLGSPLILEFLFGVALRRWPMRSRPLGAAAAALGLAAVAWFTMNGTGGIEMHQILEPGAWQRPVFFGLPAALLVFAALQFRMDWKPLVFLGDASYSLYLTHILTITALVETAPRIDPLSATAACVFVGAAVYVGAERPMLRMLRGQQGLFATTPTGDIMRGSTRMRTAPEPRP